MELFSTGKRKQRTNLKVKSDRAVLVIAAKMLLGMTTSHMGMTRSSSISTAISSFLLMRTLGGSIPIVPTVS